MDRMDKKEVLDALGVSAEFLERLIENRRFPFPFQLGDSKPAWFKKDVEAYLHLVVRGASAWASPDSATGKDWRKPVELPPYLGGTHDAIIAIEPQLIQHTDDPAVYFLMLGKQCVYIGSATTPSVRVAQHKAGVPGTQKKIFDFAYYLPTPQDKLLKVEMRYIGLVNPPLNSAGRTDAK